MYLSKSIITLVIKYKTNLLLTDTTNDHIEIDLINKDFTKLHITGSIEFFHN